MSLRQHMAHRRNIASSLEAMIRAAGEMHIAKVAPDALADLLFSAAATAGQLSDALDSVSLPRDGVQPETPIAAMFRDWRIAHAENSRVANANPSEEESEAEKVSFAKLREIEEQMFAEPVTSMADVGIKICIANGFGAWGFIKESEIWAEAKALVAGAA